LRIYSGWTTSALLRDALIPYVARELNSTYTSNSSSSAGTPSFPSPASIDAAIKSGFVKLDNEIVHESVKKTLKANSKRVAAELLAPALSGSCALLSFYDSRSGKLRVACTGDSRAILGRRSSNGKYDALALSVDQTGANKDEADRIRKEHPGEERLVIQRGRVFGGLEPTRAFGDASYKWPFDIQVKLKDGFFARSPSNVIKTPPYVTAEPVVETIDVQDGDFMVMATDGLWEMLTNEEVVGLVGIWLEREKARAAAAAKASAQASTPGGLFSFLSRSSGAPADSTAALPPTLPVNAPADEADGSAQKGPKQSRQPIRRQQWNLPTTKYTLRDNNVATHIVRNALGGSDNDTLCALLTLPSPFSRRYRDDLTVTVVFFGKDNGLEQGAKEDREGAVKVNLDASAGGIPVIDKENVKAKL
jgi:pyruvate dehydrogenase phosphatase